MSIEIIGRYCNTCDYTYFSRSRHDLMSCPCWISSERKTGGYIDGGRDYIRCGGAGTIVKITILQTEKELHTDWQEGKFNYGLIRGNVGIPIDNSAGDNA